MKKKQINIRKIKCLNCSEPFTAEGHNSKYCSGDCGQEFVSKGEAKVIITNKTLEFSEIPVDFILKNITPYHKTSLQIKYYIKMKVESWTGKKHEIYENLADELSLGFERVRRIAKE